MQKPSTVTVSVGKLLFVPMLLVALASCGSEDAPMASDESIQVVGESNAQAKCTPDTWENYGEEFFTTTCVKCHDRLARPGEVEG